MLPALVRYDIRQSPSGWTVIDTVTGDLARVDDVRAENLSEEDAGEIADLLNTLHLLQQGSLPN
jgi:hypothetical protein